MSNHLWGIDLGGTKIECVVLDTDKHEVLVRQRIPSNAEAGYENVLNQIAILVNQVSEKLSIKPLGVGIGTPGSINPYNNKLRNCNSVYLNGKAFKEDVEKKLGIPIKVSNDANCFALSEYKMGAIKKSFPKVKNVFGIIMGTGVGSGLVINGALVEGKNGIGGEWGHNFLDESGGKCYCGKSGCVEKILSGPALEKFYLGISGQKRTLKEIVSLYRSDSDDHADATMERLFYFFPKAVANVINIVDPEVVVVGGGVGNIDELYTEGIKRLPEFVFSDYIETKFVKPLLGDSSGVFGAAFL